MSRKRRGSRRAPESTSSTRRQLRPLDPLDHGCGAQLESAGHRRALGEHEQRQGGTPARSGSMPASPPAEGTAQRRPLDARRSPCHRRAPGRAVPVPSGSHDWEPAQSRAAWARAAIGSQVPGTRRGPAPAAVIEPRSGPGAHDRGDHERGAKLEAPATHSARPSTSRDTPVMPSTAPGAHEQRRPCGPAPSPASSASSAGARHPAQLRPLDLDRGAQLDRHGPEHLGEQRRPGNREPGTTAPGRARGPARSAGHRRSTAPASPSPAPRARPGNGPATGRAAQLRPLDAAEQRATAGRSMPSTAAPGRSRPAPSPRPGNGRAPGHRREPWASTSTAAAIEHGRASPVIVEHLDRDTAARCPPSSASHGAQLRAPGHRRALRGRGPGTAPRPDARPSAGRSTPSSMPSRALDLDHPAQLEAPARPRPAARCPRAP
jgi:hypothetical protein